MPVRAAIYTRISRDEAGDGLGTTRQELACRQLAHEQNVEVVGVYTDNDRSAYSGAPRPAFVRLLHDVRTGGIDMVIAWHPDRLYRRQRDLVPFIDAIQGAGANVATVTAGILDLTTPSGRMVARVVGAVAEHESEHKGERLRAKHREIASAGRWVGGHAPYGYTHLGRGRLEVNETQADLLREAARRILRGELISEVCEDFEARRVPTPRGGRWRPRDLRLMLTRPTVMGVRVLQGKVVAQGCWPPIFDEPTVMRLNRVLDYPNPKKIKRVRVAVLAGLLRCGRCGWQLYSTASGDARQYVCYRKNGGCGTVAISLSRAEPVVSDYVIRRLAGPDHDRLVPTLQARDEFAELVVDIHATMAELAVRSARGDISEAVWHEARTRLSAEADRVHASAGLVEHYDLLGGLPRNGLALADAWSRSPQHRRRQITAALIDHITIRPVTVRGARFDPRRVTDGIAWVDSDWPKVQGRGPSRTG